MPTRPLGTDLRDGGSQPFPRREQLLFVDDVVPIEHGPRLVAGEQHGDPLRYARTDQVPRRAASTIVEKPMRDLRLPTGVAQGVAPDANRDAIPAKHARAPRTARAFSTIQHLPQRD